jgi:CRP-like cAMP-binding protein
VSSEVITDLIPIRSLPHELRELVVSATVTIDASAGTQLFHRGEPGCFAWAVQTGRVHLLRSGPGGRRLVLEVVGPGDWFGAVVALQNRPYSASAVTAVASTVWKVPADVLRTVAERDPTVRAHVLDLATRRLGRAQDRLCLTVFEHLEPRLARAVLALAEETGASDEAPIRVSVGRQELADLVGTTIESVSRVISRWRRAGLVDAGRQRLTVRDLDGLRRLTTRRVTASGA